MKTLIFVSVECTYQKNHLSQVSWIQSEHRKEWSAEIDEIKVRKSIKKAIKSEDNNKGKGKEIDKPLKAQGRKTINSRNKKESLKIL